MTYVGSLRHFDICYYLRQSAAGACIVVPLRALHEGTCAIAHSPRLKPRRPQRYRPTGRFGFSKRAAPAVYGRPFRLV